MNFNVYLNEFNNCINRKNGNDLATLLTYQHREHSQSNNLLANYSEAVIAKQIPLKWNDICIFHLNVCCQISQCKFIQAFEVHKNLVQYFTKAISSMTNENWMLPVLNVLVRDLRLIAIAADLETSITRNSNHVQKPHAYLENAAELSMGLFRVTATDLRSNLETSKRKSIMNIINQLFKIYFKINKLNLCKPLVRALENSKTPEHSFSLAERVTYNYFLGMKHMFDSDYRRANELLSFSFRNCHPDSYRNKRLILIFLIPVKMLIGIMPSIKLLEQFDLMHFKDLVSAVRKGDLHSLNKALEVNSEFFWKYGIYLILEKLKIIAYRNLFKKVMLVSGGNSQIPISQFKKVLEKLEDADTKTEEVHCILANLIADGKIKGYISLQHNKLVVSKQNAFPKLSSIKA